MGRRIVERNPVIKVFGEEVDLRAEVVVLNGYSAHADRDELLRWHDEVTRHSPNLSHTWLVHGEPIAQDAFAERLRSRGAAVACPEPGFRVTL